MEKRLKQPYFPIRRWQALSADGEGVCRHNDLSGDGN